MSSFFVHNYPHVQRSKYRLLLGMRSSLRAPTVHMDSLNILLIGIFGISVTAARYS